MIGLDGHMMTNSNMDVKVRLEDMVMDDRRPQKRGGITRFVDTKVRIPSMVITRGQDHKLVCHKEWDHKLVNHNWQDHKLVNH